MVARVRSCLTLCCVVTLAACAGTAEKPPAMELPPMPEAEPPALDMQLRFEPEQAVIHKQPAEGNSERWEIGVSIVGPAGELDRMRIEHRAYGIRRHFVELDTAGIIAHRTASDASGITVSGLHQRLPASLEIDQVDVHVYSGTRMRGSVRARIALQPEPAAAP